MLDERCSCGRRQHVDEAYRRLSTAWAQIHQERFVRIKGIALGLNPNARKRLPEQRLLRSPIERRINYKIEILLPRISSNLVSLRRYLLALPRERNTTVLKARKHLPIKRVATNQRVWRVITSD
jgi:hypothetical protein